MRKIFLIVLLGIIGLAALANAESQSRALALKKFRDFATSVAVTFGEPKSSLVTFNESEPYFDLFIGQRQVGSAELFERCLATVDESDELALQCFYGVTGLLGKRDIAVDPQINADGYPISSHGGVSIEPHFRALSELVKGSAQARQVIAAAMEQSGCHKIELGDVTGSITWITQSALADEDTLQPIAGAENSWRATISCRDGKFPVYVDITERVAREDIQILLTPVRMTPGENVLILTKPVMEK